MSLTMLRLTDANVKVAHQVTLYVLFTQCLLVSQQHCTLKCMLCQAPNGLLDLGCQREKAVLLCYLTFVKYCCGSGMLVMCRFHTLFLYQQPCQNGVSVTDSLCECLSARTVCVFMSTCTVCVYMHIHCLLMCTHSVKSFGCAFIVHPQFINSPD